MQRVALWGMLLFGVLPSTSNYMLNSYGFGSGGTSNSSTATYSIEGQTGEVSGTTGTSTHTSKPGFIETQQANVPQLSALDNNSNIYYNKLHFAIDNTTAPNTNPTDALYVVEVKTSAFTSPATEPDGEQYLKSDGTLTSTLTSANFQTYAAWGGSGGSLIIGLTQNTTYFVRLQATQGKFTESQPGPALSTTTATPSITFNLVTSAQPTPPFSVSLGVLNTGIVNTSTSSINTTFTTNGASGGDVYVTSQNGGLKSTQASYTISAATADLASASNGFGLQQDPATPVSQTSGGPYSVLSPYDGAGNNVGIISALTRSLYTTNNPVIGGSGKLLLKAKAKSIDIAATDYQDVLTFTASANF